jgi:hypothetical protein
MMELPPARPRVALVARRGEEGADLNAAPAARRNGPAHPAAGPVGLMPAAVLRGPAAAADGARGPRVQLPPHARIHAEVLTASGLRTALQDTLGALARPPEGISAEDIAARQLAAHDAARRYAATPGTALDRTVPVLQAIGTVGVGALAGFGTPGRAAGIALADASVRAGVRGNGEWGFLRPAPPAPTLPGFGMVAGMIAADYVAGSLLGGLGNFLGQKVLSPVVNNWAARALQPIPAEVIVPDEMVDLMNAHGGDNSGTELRESVRIQIASANDLDSKFNTHVGEITFGLAGALAAGVPRPATGFAGSMFIGGGVSLSGGAGLGGVMAVNRMAATARVPDLERLRRDPAGALADRQPISLFYSHHKPRTFGVDIRAGFGYKSYADMGQVMGYRMLKMGQATWPLSLAMIAVPAVALGTDSSIALQFVGAVSAAGGTYFAMTPWFKALVKEFPANDAAHKPAPAAAAAIAPPGPGPDLEADLGAVDEIPPPNRNAALAP